MSAEAWITLGAACVQALTAIVIVVLTWRLVRWTAEYAATTKGQLEEAAHARAQDAVTAAGQLAASEAARATAVEVAERQLAELQEGRFAAIRPYVHVIKVGANGRGEAQLGGLTFVVDLVNVGAGPALSVRGVFCHKVLEIHRSNDSIDLPANGVQQRLELGSSVATGSNNVPMEAAVWIDYRDLLGRWWTTELPVRLQLPYDSVRGYSYQGTTIVDQHERVRQIDRPRMNIDKAAVEEDPDATA